MRKKRQHKNHAGRKKLKLCQLHTQKQEQVVKKKEWSQDKNIQWILFKKKQRWWFHRKEYKSKGILQNLVWEKKRKNKWEKKQGEKIRKFIQRGSIW